MTESDARKEMGEEKPQHNIQNNIVTDTSCSHVSIELIRAMSEQMPYAVAIEAQHRLGHVNQQFRKLFSPCGMCTDSITDVVTAVSLQVADASAFQSLAQQWIQNQSPVSAQAIELRSGERVFCDFIPVDSHSRIWMFKKDESSIVDGELPSAQFYQHILNQIPSDVAILTPDTRYAFVNRNSVKNDDLRKWMIGKTDEEYCRHLNRPEEMIKARKEAVRKVIVERQVAEWEEKRVNDEGTTEYISRRLKLSRDYATGKDWLITNGANITDWKNIKEQYSKSEKRYYDLFNYSHALICTHDLKGNFLSVNPAICKATGYNQHEMLNKNLRDIIPEHHRHEFEEQYIAAIDKEKFADGVFSVITKEGKKIYLLYHNYKVEEEGEDPYIIGFSQDITERIETEKELVKAKMMSEEAAKAKETFLANMSHEIRTPMNGILGITSLLANTDLNHEQKNFLKLIRESADHLLVIVNDVLDLEKIMAGKLQVEHQPFNLVEKISTTVESFIYKAEEKRLALIYQNAIPAELQVKGDAGRLTQVMNNLLNNAIKFTEQGNITITTRIKSLNSNKAAIEFICTDTGIGISEDKKRHVFEPFMQADAAISRKYGGTGLGLSICKNLVEMHGGTIWMDSKEGLGSTFGFAIPYSLHCDEQTKLKPAQIDFDSLGRKKVLVAEDAELNQFIVKHMMEAWGFEVDIAVNGKEALLMLQQKQYDLVLMDIQMPVMDGITATKEIRNLTDPEKSGITIIAVTANALKGDAEKYKAVGMNDYLAKPFDEEKLFHVISRNIKSPISKNKTQMSSFNGDISSEEKLYDLTIIKSISGGDDRFVAKMISLFIETVPATLKELNHALSEENWDMVNKMAHKLKSTLDSMGIQSVKQDIRVVEMNAKKLENLTQIPALVERINTIVGICIKQLQHPGPLPTSPHGGGE